MQTVIDIDRLKPLGTNILIKRMPEKDKVGQLLIPEEYRNNKNGQLFCGVVIAAGGRTRIAKLGRERGWCDVGDCVWFWHMWDWGDRDVVLKDSSSGDEYLIINDDNVKAAEIMGE